jgi:hypothetical protein
MKLSAVLIAGSLICVLFGSGCASGAKSAAMQARVMPEAMRVRESVSVKTDGGEETNPMWVSRISNPEFRIGVVESLRRSGLFRQVLDSGDSAFRLELRLENLDQPIAGFSMTVALRVQWRLVHLPDQTEVWHDRIQTVHTAAFSQAFSGVKRLRLATEGAARENIEEGLKRLATLK